MKEAHSKRAVFLVLWKWKEALRVRGISVSRCWGIQSGRLKRFDRLIAWAVHDQELYILGAIDVVRSGRGWTVGRSLYGPFELIPLKENEAASAISTISILKAFAQRIPHMAGSDTTASNAGNRPIT